MKLSIILANHGRDLSALHESIKNSRVPPDGLFVVDRGMERSIQRNLAIQQAMSENGVEDHAILWLDSDQTISPTLIGEAKNMMRMGYSALYVPEIIVADSWFGRVRQFERGFYTGTPVDVVKVVRASACPLFDEDQHGTEDSDWDRQIRGIRGTTSSVLYHHDDIQPREYFKKKAYYAKSLARFADRNPGDKVLSPSYRCIKIFTEKGKWRRLIRHPILSIGILFIIAIRGIIYVKSKCCHRHL